MRYDLWKTQRDRTTVLESGLKVLKENDVLLMFTPRAKNPYVNVFSRDPARLDELQERYVERYEAHLKWKKGAKARNAFTEEDRDAVKVGEVWYTSWGYDQTNYDYVVVEEVSASGKTVKARRARHKNCGVSGTCNVQEPVAQGFGDQFRLSVRKCNYDGKVSYSLTGKYPFCFDGTGSRRSGGFSKARAGQKFHETDSMFGH